MGIWETLVDLIARVQFFAIVRLYEGGVQLRMGRIHRPLPPGFYWIIPVIDAVEILDVVPQVVDLPNQSILTEDNKTVAFSGILEYSISSPAKALTAVHDLDTSIQSTVMHALQRELSSCTLDEAQDTDAMEERVIAQVQPKLRRWGVKVHHIGLTDLAPHRVLRLLTADQSIETE